MSEGLKHKYYFFKLTKTRGILFKILVFKGEGRKDDPLLIAIQLVELIAYVDFIIVVSIIF